VTYSWLAPGRYVVGDDGVARKAAPPKRLVADGYACHYGVVHQNYRTGGRELFSKGCFDGSLYDCLFLVDHVLSQKALGDQSDGSLELHDCDAGLAVRLHLKNGDLERLEGRDQLSMGYHVTDSTVRSDGVRVIQKAIAIEVSACHAGAVRQTFLDIRDADDVGPLETDSKNWAYDGTGRAFTRALAKL
jgi:phage head maturation protease